MNQTSKMIHLMIDGDAELELANIRDGVFAPLKGFLDGKDYHSVVENMHLAGGHPWTIPVTLAVPEDRVQDVIKAEIVELRNASGTKVAELDVEDVYQVHFDGDLPKVFGTADRAHPGVAKEASRSPFRVGGAVRVFAASPRLFPEFSPTPAETREIFRERGWQTVTGFQTRNPLHRAHEYLQRVAMELTDGVFLQPLIGWKKTGDVTPDGVLAAYDYQVRYFYPRNRAFLGTLQTPMRYAGPREAVFHALIRKNYGCTHFIVGRDHAGVGSFYGKYEAQALCSQFADLGIDILALCGPYYCQKCATVVTEKTCPHGEKYALSVSGTELRALMKSGRRPPAEFMRPEISDVLLKLHAEGRLFIGD